MFISAAAALAAPAARLLQVAACRRQVAVVLGRVLAPPLLDELVQLAGLLELLIPVMGMCGWRD